MARRARVEIHRSAIIELMTSAAAEDLVASKAEDLANACNAESTWGGYEFAVESDGTRARARVWSIDDRADEARENRMIRNLDAGA